MAVSMIDLLQDRRRHDIIDPRYDCSRLLQRRVYPLRGVTHYSGCIYSCPIPCAVQAAQRLQAVFSRHLRASDKISSLPCSANGVFRHTMGKADRFPPLWSRVRPICRGSANTDLVSSAHVRTTVLGTALVAANLQKLNLKLSFLQVALNIGLNVLLIPRYSYFGASFATVVAVACVVPLDLFFLGRNGFALRLRGASLPALFRLGRHSGYFSTAAPQWRPTDADHNSRPSCIRCHCIQIRPERTRQAVNTQFT